MKIAVIVRTRDEEHRIAKFCEAYSDADVILVGDGGSVDRTIEIARTYPNVEVRSFEQRTELEQGHWRNNDSDHTNWLIAWAKEHNPDWIISDDCDCRPNADLRKVYRSILEQTEADFVMAVRVYLWGKDHHFPEMAKPGRPDHDKWEASVWAWRGHLDFWTVDVFPHFTLRIGSLPVKDLRADAKTLEIFPPLCLLHHSWDDPKRVEEKVRIHRESGSIPGQLHPLAFAGPLELLPEWAVE